MESVVLLADIGGGDGDLTMEEASSMAVEGAAVEVVGNALVDPMGLSWIVPASRMVCGWPLVLEGLLLIVIGSEVALSRVAGLCGVMVVAALRMVPVLGACLGVMVGPAGTGVVVLRALILVGTTNKVLGERVEVRGLLKEGRVRGDLVVVRVGRQDEVTAQGMVVCSLGMNRWVEKVVMVDFSLFSSP